MLQVYKKLIKCFLKLFKVLVKISMNAYKLNLSIKYKCLYYTFYIFLLKVYYI